ncbi:MAG: hypothetical protein AAGF24_01295 [Cyanobacteria bacterium P01_H01_bin.121]
MTALTSSDICDRLQLPGDERTKAQLSAMVSLLNFPGHRICVSGYSLEYAEQLKRRIIGGLQVLGHAIDADQIVAISHGDDRKVDVALQINDHYEPDEAKAHFALRLAARSILSCWPVYSLEDHPVCNMAPLHVSFDAQPLFDVGYPFTARAVADVVSNRLVEAIEQHHKPGTSICFAHPCDVGLPVEILVAHEGVVLGATLSRTSESQQIRCDVMAAIAA